MAFDAPGFIGDFVGGEFGGHQGGCMITRTAGSIAILLIAIGEFGGQALAQYYPPAQAYPPQAPTVGAQLPSPNAPVQEAPLPPVGVGPDYQRPVDARYGQGAGAYPADAVSSPVAGDQGYQPVPPQDYAGARPYYGTPGAIPGSAQQDAIREEAMRSRLGNSPGQIGAVDPRAPESSQGGGPPPNMAAFPPEVRPETEPKKELPPQFRRTLVDYRTTEPAGTIIVDTPNTYLYLVLGRGKALRYGVGVGREGFTWSGAQRITRTLQWPDWTPPEEMIVRQPYLPRFMAGGETNPLGARALYLGNTVYRIHGTNQPSTIGTFVSSGCIRLTNEDVMDLYNRVRVGTRVVVLPGGASAAMRPPAAASLGPVLPGGASAAMRPPAPPPLAPGASPAMRPPAAAPLAPVPEMLPTNAPVPPRPPGSIPSALAQ
jgi:lipoprotein-anchoring transpeptidase ErfK/SrfK